jgi:hypothetical protein
MSGITKTFGAIKGKVQQTMFTALYKKITPYFTSSISDGLRLAFFSTIQNFPM